MTVVLKLLGLNIIYGVLFNRISNLWKPIQPFQLMDIENGYFLAKFQNNEDYEKVLTQGPWAIFNHSAVDKRLFPSSTIPECGYGLDQVTWTTRIYVQEEDSRGDRKYDW